MKSTYIRPAPFIAVRDFGPIAHADVELKPLTVLIGPTIPENLISPWRFMHCHRPLQEPTDDMGRDGQEGCTIHPSPATGLLRASKERLVPQRVNCLNSRSSGLRGPSFGNGPLKFSNGCVRNPSFALGRFRVIWITNCAAASALALSGW